MAGRLIHRPTMQRLLGRCLQCYKPTTAVSSIQSKSLIHACHRKVEHVHQMPSQPSIMLQISRGKKFFKRGEDKYFNKSTNQKSLVLAKKLFENTPPELYNKENFKSVVDTFTTFDVRNRGYLQFIEIGLRNMKKFGVEKDVEAYNVLLDLFPKGPFVPNNFFQSIMNHAPEQQTMGMKLMQQMEDQLVMPNKQTREILRAVFGQHSHPMKKYMRMMYWFPKMWHLNPFPLPEELPKEYIKLCELGLKRIAEYEAKFSVSYLKGSYPDSEEPEFITTMQSSEQQEMLAEQPVHKALYVEGAFTLWLCNVQMSYFILRGDPFTMIGDDGDDDTDENDYRLGDTSLHDFAKKKQTADPSLHSTPNPIQEGPIFAMCMTTNQTEETLRQWIQTLQEENPHLANIPVYFNLFNLKGQHHASELIGDNKLISSS